MHCDLDRSFAIVSSLVFLGRSVGSCLRKKNGEAMNGGHVSNLLEVTLEGSLRILYSGGELCGGGQRSTLILLKCSSVAVRFHVVAEFSRNCNCRADCLVKYVNKSTFNRQHEPMLLSDVDDCEALIQWETPFACPNKVSVSHDLNKKKNGLKFAEICLK